VKIYSVFGTISAHRLEAVIAAFGDDGVTVALEEDTGEVNLVDTLGQQGSASQEPEPEGKLPTILPADALQAPKRTVRRTRGNGEWPAAGSTYSVALQAIREGGSVVDAMIAAGFSKGSANTAVERLLKANKIKKDDSGYSVVSDG
jgi:hypothetical protein